MDYVPVAFKVRGEFLADFGGVHRAKYTRIVFRFDWQCDGDAISLPEDRVAECGIARRSPRSVEYGYARPSDERMDLRDARDASRRREPLRDHRWRIARDSGACLEPPERVVESLHALRHVPEAVPILARPVRASRCRVRYQKCGGTGSL